MPAKTKKRTSAARSRSFSATKSARARSRGGPRSASSKTRSARPASRGKSQPRSKRQTTAVRSPSKTSGAATRRSATARATAPARGGQTAVSRETRSRTSGQITVDHDEIRRWVEQRGGRPAAISGTERAAEPAGLLRIDFPGYTGEETLAPIGWDEFFEKFEESNLSFLYDPDPGSKFNKFIAREGSPRD